jgi:TRAP-type C4-dicarboxylate transport system substrate-binding protein
MTQNKIKKYIKGGLKMLEKFTTELSAKMTLDNLNKLKESNPEEYDETIKAFIAATEVGINFLKESPEFRKAFAKIHKEFLKYPECREVIEAGLQANEKFDAIEYEH